MRLKRTVTAALLAVTASSAAADMVVVNGRYVVARDEIRGYFYRQSDRRMVFDIRWSDWSTQYRCSDTYDEARIEAAALNFTLQMADARSVDFGVFLEAEGFSDCAKF